MKKGKIIQDIKTNTSMPVLISTLFYVFLASLFIEGGLWLGSESVSYTHLDVYKRQWMNLAWIVQSMNSTLTFVNTVQFHTVDLVLGLNGWLPSRLVLNTSVKLFHSHVCCIVSNLNRRKNAIRRFSLLSASKNYERNFNAENRHH